MNRRINPKQMEAWINKLQINMKKFLDGKSELQENRLEFIREQYALLDITVKALNGDVFFVGCSHPNT